MKYSISPFIKILFVTLIILITFPTHLLAYTSNSNPLSSTAHVLMVNGFTTPSDITRCFNQELNVYKSLLMGYTAVNPRALLRYLQ